MDKQEYNIVIADNHPVVIQGLIAMFGVNSRFKVVGVAQDGDDLRKVLEKSTVDTLFMDLKLPTTNIYRLIKDLVVTQPQLKIIAFTNYTMPKLVQDVMEFGVNAYLSKTASILEIKKSIKRVHNGEQFISDSVYHKGVKEKIIGNELLLEGEDDFIRFSDLTEREMDIVILLSRGYTNKEMADKLFLSKFTVDTHRRNLMKKLKLKTTGHLIYFATQQGLI